MWMSDMPTSFLRERGAPLLTLDSLLTFNDSFWVVTPLDGMFSIDMQLQFIIHYIIILRAPNCRALYTFYTRLF